MLQNGTIEIDAIEYFYIPPPHAHTHKDKAQTFTGGSIQCSKNRNSLIILFQRNI